VFRQSVSDSEVVSLGRRSLDAISDGATIAFLLVMPLSAAWPLGKPVVEGPLELYVTPVWYLSDLPLLAGLVSTLVARRPGRFWSPVLSLPLTALAILGFVVVPWAIYPKLALYFAGRWLMALAALTLIVRSRLSVRRLVSWFAFGLFLQTLLGAAQVAQGGSVGLPGELALPANLGGAAIIDTPSGRFLRAYGLTFHPNVFGGFLVVGMLVALPLVDRWRRRLLWWGLEAGLFLTFSRSAWIAAAATIPLAGLWIARRFQALRNATRITLAGGLLVALLGAVAFSEPLRTRLQPMTARAEQVSLSSRLESLSIALQIIREHPAVGVGPGLFPAEIARSQWGVVAEPVHNVTLLLAAEVGVFGGALWVWLMAWPAVLGRRLRAGLSPWGIVCLGACIAVAVVSLADSYPWGLAPGQLLTAFVFGAAEKEIRSGDAV